MATTVNNTMVKIQTVTVGSGGASTIDFTSIPQTYTDLVIVASLRGDASYNYTDVKVEFNGVTTGYTRRTLYGDGTSVGSGSDSTARFTSTDLALATASTFANVQLYIPNYTSSNYKSVSSDTSVENNSASNNLNMMVAGLWSNTAAITSIKLTPLTGGNFVQYSSATLYGVTATPNTTKASGGIIYQDATYMYHVFPYTSTFTPSTSLSCDYLVIAGGGGGGNAYAGGGGAGGYKTSTGYSLTANTAYTVTVGGGGAGSTSSSSKGTSGSNSVFDTITSTGGGGGGSELTNAGASGGSGGGASYSGTGGAASPSGQGNAGGNGSTTVASNRASGGGGGGAGAAGTNAPDYDNGGAGGVGLSTQSSWAIATNTGVIVSGTGYYAGGGGGGNGANSTGVAGAGGLGGGGKGGRGTAGGDMSGTAATINTGSGGGGGGGAGSGTQNGGAGGSGIVIIRYAK